MPRPPEPVLETPRLLLRPMQPDDLDRLMAIFGDPKVMAVFGVPPFNRDQMAGWLQEALDHHTAHGYAVRAVILKSSGDLIGDCGLELKDVDGVLIPELGYDFASAYWNQDYATEAARAVRDDAFGRLGLLKLISLIRVGNLPSRRVAEKVGMRYLREMVSYERPYWLFEIERPPAP